jgi:hypothetical protein
MTLSLLSVLALAIFMNGLTLYPGFVCKLTSRTDVFLLSVAASAGTNVVLNIILVPHYGAIGAAI